MRMIRESGSIPVERDTLYKVIKIYSDEAVSFQH
jgi:2-iminoacetate synthase ThiH